MSDVETLAKQFTAHLELNNTLIRELTAERDTLRAAIKRAVERLADIELEQEIYAAQHIRVELGAAKGGRNDSTQ